MAADAKVRRLRAPLLRWYRRAARDLPWRRTSDPYAIWVSEIMLQQTTVAAVLPYWERFLAKFPDVASLARAKEEHVLAAWTGLGYYRRARSLREGAIAVAEHHGGRVPSSFDELIALPGIGRYTAGAIASVAFERETPVVDGNVKRVFSRLFGFNGKDDRHWEIATALVKGETPGDLNQAVMELGATVCTPRSPSCHACPLSKWCAARALGSQESFPAPPPRKKPVLREIALAWIEKRGRVLLEKKRDGGPLRGSWDLPAAASTDTLKKELKARHGLAVSAPRSIGRVSHTILSTKLSIEIVAATLDNSVASDALRWIPIAKLRDVATSSATLKAAQKRSQVSRGTPSGSSFSSSAGRVSV